MESKLATQLRLLIIQLDVAQAKHRKALEEFTREKENLEAEKKQFQEECATKSREIAQLRTDLRGKKDRHDVHAELERRVKELEKELEERRTKDVESASRISHLRTDLNAERNSRKLLEEQLKELKEKHQRNTTLTVKLRECEDAKKTTNDCTQKLAGRNETLLEQLEKARGQCNEKSTEISRLRLELRKYQEPKGASLESRPQIRTGLRHTDTRSAPSAASSSVNRQPRPSDQEDSSVDELSRTLMSTTPKDKHAKTVSWGPPVYYSPRNSDHSVSSEADTSVPNLTENPDMEPVKVGANAAWHRVHVLRWKGKTTRFVQLVDHCSLYKYDEGDLLWVGRPSQRFTVYYSATAKAYCVVTAAGTRIRWFHNAQLEIYYANGDLSAVFPSGRRVEHITPPRSDTFFEIWEPDSKTATKHTMTGDSAITSISTDRMSERANKSFVSRITSDGHPSLQFENAEFKIRRTEDGIAKLHLIEEQSQVTLKSGDEMQVLINHVKQQANGEKEKQTCCRHTPDGAIVADGISVLPAASSSETAPRGLNRKYLKPEQAAPRPLDEGYFLSGPLQRHASDEHDLSAEYGVDPNSAK
ncbi:hypothetical protein AAVH_41256 [Aphelenchoides avenae]|nr:hypothetical protein AAVH_41256 [Aphelenchus avenae]